MSRLETSRDTNLHVSVWAQSRRIHVLSWLESHSSMSRLGSVSWLSWRVLAQCVLRSWHIWFEHYSFVKFVVSIMLVMLVKCTVMCALWRCVEVMLNCFGLSHVLIDTCVSQCLTVSSLEHFHYVSVSSRLNQIRNVSARLMSRYLDLSWPCLWLRKKCLNSITVTWTKLTLHFDDVGLWLSHMARLFPHGVEVLVLIQDTDINLWSRSWASQQ